MGTNKSFKLIRILFDFVKFQEILRNYFVNTPPPPPPSRNVFYESSLKVKLKPINDQIIS